MEIVHINLPQTEKRRKPIKLANLQSKKKSGFVPPRKKIFKTVERNPADYRKVSMFDHKNTVKIIKLNDPRSDDQIRQEWSESTQRRLKSN